MLSHLSVCKLFCMIFRISNKEQTTFLVICKQYLTFQTFFFLSLIEPSAVKLLKINGSNSDNFWHKIQRVPSIPSPRASSLQALPSGCVVWVMMLWWQWVVKQMWKSLISTLLWSSISYVLKQIQVCGESLTLPDISQSPAQIWAVCSTAMWQLMDMGETTATHMWRVK